MNVTRKTFMGMLAVVTATMVMYALYSRDRFTGLNSLKLAFWAVPLPSSELEKPGAQNWTTATLRSSLYDHSQNGGSITATSGGQPATDHQASTESVTADNRKDVAANMSSGDGNVSAFSSSLSTSKLLTSETTLKTIQIPTGPPQKILCVNFIGRLGNQMFQYASVLGLSQKLNRIAVFKDSSLLAKSLKSPPLQSDPELLERCHKATLVKEDGCCHFQHKFLEMDPGQDFRVGTYMQSYLYFDHFQQEVRAALTFSDSAQKYANSTRETMQQKRPHTALVGVHIRRGDYLQERSIKIGYRTAPPSFFRDAFSYMRQRFGNVTFLVSVDSEDWLRKEVTTASDIIVLQRQDPAWDMALLSSLDHVITSVGTYSWWVGYLNRGVTVYWKDFFDIRTDIGSSFLPNATTFIYPTWIPL